MYKVELYSSTVGDSVVHTLDKEAAYGLLRWAYEHEDATADMTTEDTLAVYIMRWMESIADEGKVNVPMTIYDEDKKALAWFTHHGDGRCTIRAKHGMTVGFRLEDVEDSGYCLAIRDGRTSVVIDVSEWEVDPE